MRARILFLASLLSSFFFSGIASAAEGPELAPAPEAVDGVRRYEPPFFVRFYPQTALDMLQRLPGFSLDGGDEVRGFGGSAGNVLIDGARPSTKSLDLEEVLARIPAKSVRAIEVIQGAQRAGETAGQSLIANVIRDSSRTSGAWTAEVKREPDGLVYPVFELSLANQLGDWSLASRANYYWEEFDFQEFTRRRFDADGNLELYQDESAPRKEYSGAFATEAQRALGEGTLVLNGRVALFDFANDADRIGFRGREGVGEPDERRRIQFDERSQQFEFGLTLEQPLFEAWQFKNITLASLDRREEQSLVVSEEPFGTVDSSSVFSGESDQTEFITRFTFGRDPLGSLAPEVGFELARNELDRALKLTRDEGTGPVAFNLPNANAVVEELRGEAFVNLVWTLSPRWIAEIGMAGEVSEISVAGDSDNEQQFSFLKPTLALNARLNPNAQLRLSLRRSVGQLDFDNFAAATEVQDDRLLGGNPSLGPDQTTTASMTFDLRSEKRGALNVELFHDWTEDTLEQVVLPSGASGLANAGDSRFWGVFGSAFVPLNGLLPGGLLRLEFETFESEFEDPITGETRDITDFDTPNVELTLRQDRTAERWSWGLFYSVKTDTLDYFTDEISRGARGEEWTAFVETTRLFDLRTRLELRFFKRRGFPRERLFFAPDRSGAFVGSEQLDRERGMFINLQFSGQF
ncbi:MAG: TonB-dependent receptor [Pseudomonadota bacterium]